MADEIPNDLTVPPDTEKQPLFASEVEPLLMQLLATTQRLGMPMVVAVQVDAEQYGSTVVQNVATLVGDADGALAGPTLLLLMQLLHQLQQLEAKGLVATSLSIGINQSSQGQGGVH